MVIESLSELHVLFLEVRRTRLWALASSGLLAWATCQASWGQTQSGNRYRQPVQAILIGNQSSPNAPIDNYPPVGTPSVNLLDEHGALLEKGTYAGGASLLAPPTAGDREPVGSDASLLESMGPATGSANLGSNLPGAAHGAEPASRDGLPAGLDPHAEVFANDLYPSATKCAQCHKKIYDEWRVSAHAYAAVSPMFNKFEQKMTELTKGTVEIGRAHV